MATADFDNLQNLAPLSFSHFPLSSSRKRGSLCYKVFVKDKKYFIYIMGNLRPTLYIGVTSDLIKRAYEHKNGAVDGFTKKYKLHNLLYYEIYNNINDAITREKQLKHWNRKWKLDLIEKVNPKFKDLYQELAS